MKTAIVFLFISNFVYGQLTGKVTTPKGEAVQFVNVLLFVASDSSRVSGTTTNEEGAYQLPLLKTGRFYLRISGIGYQTRFSEAFEVSSSNPTLKIPELALLEEENTSATVCNIHTVHVATFC